MASKQNNNDEEQDQVTDHAEAPARDEDAGTPHAEQAGQTDRVDQAEQRCEKLASELEEAQARYLRLAADFENYKKRARQEQLETIQYAAATLVERLLPVLDDAQRALEHAPEGTDEGWLRGVRLTFQHLEEALAAVGVQPIEAVGRPFDPKLDEAIGSEESDEHPDDTVVTELRRGYRMHDRVLRPALVKVSRRPAQDN
jgi:molecular chaperone GrpE